MSYYKIKRDVSGVVSRAGRRGSFNLGWVDRARSYKAQLSERDHGARHTLCFCVWPLLAMTSQLSCIAGSLPNLSGHQKEFIRAPRNGAGS